MDWKFVTPKKWQNNIGVPQSDKKERKTWIKTFAQNYTDKTDEPINVTYYTSDAICIALSVEKLWEECEYENWA